MSQPDALVRQERVRRDVLRTLLCGAPVTASGLAARTGLPVGDVEEILAALDAAGAIYRRDGAVVAAYPLSGIPTRHRLGIGGATAYANCAFDALAVPFLVDEPVTITSDCAHCGAGISVHMNRERVLDRRPDSPVVFYVSRDDCCEAGPALLTRCPHINFFCDAEHAHAWQAAHPGRTGSVLGLTQAVARAREGFDRTIRLLRGTP